MSILDVDKKYESKDVLTSFNYGKPLSSVTGALFWVWQFYLSR